MVTSLAVFLLVICAVNAQELRFIAIGDWGVNDAEQVLVAGAMDTWCGDIGGCDFIMSLGDNFYGDYIRSSNDTRFETHWRDIYTGDNIKDLVWHIAVGNHDSSVFNSELYQVEFGETEPRWYQPWLWYDFYMTAGSALVHFVCIDTPSLLQFKHNVTEQRRWINDTIGNSEADWIVVYGHHPMFSSGRYPGYPRVDRDVAPVMTERGADIFLAGHDHNMQHLQTENVTSQAFEMYVNGGGGRGLYEYSRVNERYANNNGKDVVFFDESHGFTGITITEDSMTLNHYTYGAVNETTGSVDAVLVYTYQRVKDDYLYF